jgi:putative ABC transport system substrate-binding protein
VTVEYRWGDGQYERVPALAADLVQRQVAVIAAIGGSNAALAAKAATSTIPIVFITGDDPVKQGLVTSLNRPGGNATGINIFISEMEGKRLGLLRELVPGVRSIGVLLNPAYSAFDAQLNELRKAAHAVGQQIRPLTASNDQELHAAFASLVEAREGALLVVAEPFFNSRREQIVALAAQYAIPALYIWLPIR